MSTRQYLFSGFGGQGILFAGKFLASKGLIEDKEVSWLPSYGPEMRGGTASCSVIVGDDPIGSPIIATANCLVAMNLPSLDKYEPTVKPGGAIFVDSTLIERKVQRDDVDVYYIPATKLASDNNMPTLANMILMGKILKVYGEYTEEGVRAALGKVVSSRHADLLEVNLRAMQIGADYE